MRIILKLSVITLLMINTTESNAQFLERLKNKIEQKLERKAENKIEKEIDKGIDEVTTKKSTKKKTKKTSETSKQKTTKTVAVSPLNQYSFSHETKVLVTSVKDNQTYKMSYLLNPNGSYVGMKTDMSEYSDKEVAGESIIIMDDGDVHIFVETQGMKIRMSQGMMNTAQQNPTNKMANYDYKKIKKTGRTKTILNYKCYEYTMSDKDVKIELWVTPEIDLPNWFVQNKEVIDGHILGYTMESKEGKMYGETTAINDNIRQTINPNEYKKMF